MQHRAMATFTLSHKMHFISIDIRNIQNIYNTAKYNIAPSTVIKQSELINHSKLLYL